MYNKKISRLAAFCLAGMLMISSLGCGSNDHIESTGGLQSIESTTAAPSTAAPSTAAPSTAAPSTAAPSTAAPSTAADGAALGITAQSAVLYDCSKGTYLVEKRADNLVYPASTAKLLTALVAVQYVPLEEVVTVGEELTLVEPHSSLAYLAKGQQLTMDMMLHALLIPSGNDAAYSIAAHTGRIIANNPALSPADAVAVFVQQMNQLAASLGMKHSTFTNPDGYDDPAQQTTAYDLALLGAAFLQHSELTAITSLPSYHAVFVSGEQITWKNTNELLDSSGANYTAECIGLKTGSSTYSGYCLVSAFVHNGRQYVGVIMNSAKANRWSDSLLLYQYLSQS